MNARTRRLRCLFRSGLRIMQGKTPLDAALDNGRVDCARMLLELQDAAGHAQLQAHQVLPTQQVGRLP
jgi:hypothetical protein